MTKNLLIIGFIAGVIAMGLFFGISQYQTNTVTLYHVYVDGEKIGTVDNKAILDIWESQELRKAEELYGSAAFEIKNNITFKKEIVYKGSFNNLETIDALKTKVEIQAKGIELFINGKGVGVVGDQAAADRLINNIKQEYLPQTEKTKASAASLDEDIKQEVTLESIKIKEDIQMRERIVSPEEIISEENMFNLLIQGTTVSTPLVTVQTKELTTLVETIPYSVVYQKDNTMIAPQKA